MFTRLRLLMLMVVLPSTMFAEITVNNAPMPDWVLVKYPTLAGQQGAFWLDCRSGLWGAIGGPSQGQLPPHFKINCDSMSAHVSGQGTEVFINSRALHSEEVRFLESLFGHVAPGRYWLNHQGTGGIEGNPQPLFNIAQRIQLRSSQGGQSRLLSGWGSEWAGNVIGDRDTVGFIPSNPGGISVTCGPDGGCIY